MKIALLLLVVGLAVGLWLGFNPQMHTRMVQAWRATQSFFAEIGTKAAAGHRVTSPGGKVASSPTNSSEWKRVSSDFGELWNLIQRTWHDIGVSLHLI